MQIEFDYEKLYNLWSNKVKKIRLNRKFKPKKNYLWIFSNEIKDDLSSYIQGELVEVYLSNGKFYGVGYINPKSFLAIRILTFNKQAIDKSFFKKRIETAFLYRKKINYASHDAYRLCFAESDFLPGIIIDKYKEIFVVQILTAGMENYYPLIKEILIEMFNPKAIILKNDSFFRNFEGLEQFTKVEYGIYSEEVIIEEEGVKYVADLLKGQKTGFFLDQRENRLYLRELLKNRDIKTVLDCFSYSGGWGLNAGKVFKGKIFCVDSSERALQLAKINSEINKIKIEVIRKDVFDFLKEAHMSNKKFDCIILDPPAFIKSKSKIKEGISGYKEINQRAMRILSKGGILITASCSHHMGRETFLDMLKICAYETKRSFRIIKKGTQSPDHPVLLTMPETDYLKVVFLENID